MLIGDAEFARRLCGSIVDEMLAFVDTARRLYPDTSAETRVIDGGAAMCGADAIPFSEAAGFGLEGPIDDATLDAVDAFFAGCGCDARVDVCSLADPSVMIGLARRGYMPARFEDVLVLDLAETAASDADADAAVRLVAADERDDWAALMTRGFAGGHEPTDVERRFGRVVAARDWARLVWAWDGGVPVATGEVAVAGDVAWLSADTTLESHRGRGFQGALQRARLALAREAGCGLAVSEAVPGGVSHRNLERLGFRVAFTHLAMVRRGSEVR